MLILCGKTCSGKSTVANILAREFGFRRNVTYTTRPMRPGERDGVDYNFVTEEEFTKLTPSLAEMTEYNASFGYCRYGSLGSDYADDGILKVSVLNPSGIEAIRRAGYKPFVIELEVSEDVLRKRLEERGDAQKEVNRRLEDDEKRFEAWRRNTLGPDVILTIKEDETPIQTAGRVYTLVTNLELRLKNPIA